jgi:hypothetical protein
MVGGVEVVAPAHYNTNAAIVQRALHPSCCLRKLNLSFVRERTVTSKDGGVHDYLVRLAR